jgi:pimeloyl-ACP methyl ester carboxylesterase
MHGSRSADGLWVERHGDGSDVLLLVHGLAANGATWDPLLALAAKEWPGEIIVSDLRGHGRSDHRGNYSFGTMAADLAGLVAPGARLSIIGHSLGGLLGAFIGTGWFGVDVTVVLGLSVKVKWAADEIEKGRAIAGNPIRWMPSREEALDRYLRVSGLASSAAQMARSADAGIVDEGGQYRLAADGAIFGAAALGVPSILKVTRCSLVLATGEKDPIAPPSDFAELGLPVTTIAGAGHQVHVEAPADVWRLFSSAHQATLAAS